MTKKLTKEAKNEAMNYLKEHEGVTYWQVKDHLTRRGHAPLDKMDFLKIKSQCVLEKVYA